MRRYFPTSRKNLQTKIEDFVLTSENPEVEDKETSYQDCVEIISNYEQ